MNRSKSSLGALCALLVVAAAGSAHACYWDKDTLAMEKRRFPDVAQMLSDDFLRHSAAFYTWRVADRRARLEKTPDDLALRDDLAVALDKLGQHAAAIAVAEESLRRAPDRYETLANLGTIHLHAGHLEDGMRFIRRALEINPDAHFGREVVQLRLVEYLIAARAKRPGLPLDSSWDATVAAVRRDPAFAKRDWYFEVLEGKDFPMGQTSGFAAFARARGLDRAAALKGLLGMMRFGQAGHPALNEAIGDVLLWDWLYQEDAKRLAARAYLRAAAGSADPEVAAQYRARAALALMGHKGLTLEAVEREAAAELARGAAKQKRVAEDEARWIAEGADVEARFVRKYYRDGRSER